MKPALPSAFAAWVFVPLLMLVTVTLPALNAAAQDDPPDARELVVGTKDAPPFAIKNDRGEWSGVGNR